jgi:hypothetical protein
LQFRHRRAHAVKTGHVLFQLCPCPDERDGTQALQRQLALTAFRRAAADVRLGVKSERADDGKVIEKIRMFFEFDIRGKAVVGEPLHQFLLLLRER